MRRATFPQPPLRPLRTTLSHTCSGTVTTNTTHRIAMLSLGAGLWSFTAPRCGASPVSWWDGGDPRLMTHVAPPQRRGTTRRRQRCPSGAVPRLRTGCRPGGLMWLYIWIPPRPANNLVFVPGGRRPPPHGLTPQPRPGGSSKAWTPPHHRLGQGSGSRDMRSWQTPRVGGRQWSAPSPQRLAGRRGSPSTRYDWGWRAPPCTPVHRPPPPRWEGGPNLTTPHAKQRWISESAATLPMGALGEGEGRSTPTPATTISCSTSAKAWTVAYKRPSMANTGAGSAAVG